MEGLATDLLDSSGDTPAPNAVLVLGEHHKLGKRVLDNRVFFEYVTGLRRQEVISRNGGRRHVGENARQEVQVRLACPLR